MNGIRFATVAACALAFGWTTARAETTPAAPSTLAPPASDIHVNTPPGSDVHVNVNPAVTPPPASGTTGTSESDVNVEPTPAPAQTTEINVEPAPTTVVPVPVPVQPVAPVPPAPDRASTAPAYGSSVGAGLLLGGGFEDFTNSNLRGMTSGAGYWNARVVAGTRTFVGAEAAYVGDARNIEALGLSTDARLVSNGLEGALRVNVPIMRNLTLVEPFGFVGVGWSHYNVTNTNINTSDIASRDDVMTVPFGGGLAFGYGAFMADARFTYRQTYYNNLLANGNNLNNWGVGGQLGVAF